MFEGGEQKGAEFAFFGLNLAEVVLVEELGEEGLGEVLGSRGVVAVSAEEGVEGEPVGFAEGAEGLGAFWGGGALGGEYDAPVGGHKSTGRRARGRGVWIRLFHSVLLGSVGQNVIGHAPCPVLVVPDVD